MILYNTLIKFIDKDIEIKLASKFSFPPSKGVTTITLIGKLKSIIEFNDDDKSVEALKILTNGSIIIIDYDRIEYIEFPKEDD